MHWTLAIDTSSSYSSATLRSDSNTFSYLSSTSGQHSEELATEIRNLLAKAGVLPSNLTNLICGSGPGSFTGLRIGLSFLKGLAVGRAIPIFMHSSLEALAWGVRTQASIICAIADARRGEVFAGYFLFSNNAIKRIGEESILSFAESEKKLRELSAIHNIEISKSAFVLVDPVEGFPSTSIKICVFTNIASALVDVVNLGANPTYSVNDIASLAPSYLREVAAQTIAERKRSST